MVAPATWTAEGNRVSKVHSMDTRFPSAFVNAAALVRTNRRDFAFPLWVLHSISAIAILRPGGLLPVCPWIAQQILESGLKYIIRQSLEQSLFFKTPYVWDDRRPLPLAELGSPSRPVGHVHERRLDAASDCRVTAVLPV